LEGAVVGLDRFGESAPGAAVMKYLGFTAEQVAEVAGQA
jgi:transketolase